jgi:hypothetical protein
MHRNTTFTSARAQRRISRILQELAHGALPAVWLANKVHCDHSMITDYLQYLMAPPRRVRIVGHEVVNGSKRPLYGLGSDADVPNTVQTNQEKWEKVKSDPVKYSASLESRKEHHRRKRALVPMEERKRDRRVYNPPLIEQVEMLVSERPGFTRLQIAEQLDANERAVMLVLQKLMKAEKVRPCIYGNRKAHQYETVDRPLPPPPEIPKVAQNPFSALFM